MLQVCGLLLILFCISYILFLNYYKKRKFTPVNFEDDILYQYIREAHLLVLNLVAVDPLSQPVKFQQELNRNIDIISPKIDLLRQQYVETIAKDTEYGKTIQNYEFWKKSRNSWIVMKKPKLNVVKTEDNHF